MFPALAVLNREKLELKNLPIEDTTNCEKSIQWNSTGPLKKSEADRQLLPWKHSQVI